MTVAEKNAHGVYVDHDDQRLYDGKSRIALAEVRVALTADGYRAATSFMFTTRNWWGSSSPITDHDQPFAHRADAVAFAANRLADRLAAAARHEIDPSMEGQRRKIIAWLAGLTTPEPRQMEMFA